MYRVFHNFHIQQYDWNNKKPTIMGRTCFLYYSSNSEYDRTFGLGSLLKFMFCLIQFIFTVQQ